MTRPEAITRIREGRAKHSRTDGERESTHPWRLHNPGWLKSDRGHPALPDKHSRVIKR